MQNTEHHARLPYLSAPGRAFCIITTLILLVNFSVRAADPVAALAVADLQTPAAPPTSSAQADLLAHADLPLFDSSNEAPGETDAHKTRAAIVATDSRLQTPANFELREPLRLDGKNLGQLESNFRVQAGYGRIWDEKSMLSKISPGHQEVGCAYVHAQISF